MDGNGHIDGKDRHEVGEGQPGDDPLLVVFFQLAPRDPHARRDEKQQAEEARVWFEQINVNVDQFSTVQDVTSR